MNLRRPEKKAADENILEENETLLDIRQTGWDLYNNRAKRLDQDALEGWDRTLQSLLVFAALFSAILTAFAMESMKKLEEDQQETASNLLKFLATQNYNHTSNATVASYPSTDWTPEPHFILINSLLFLSLGISLVVAFVAIFILRWIDNYNILMSRMRTAEEKAKARHYRYEAAKRYRLNGIIMTLPVLLYVSLWLFFIGIFI
ncbi:hypothetical protein CPB86DRAFT_706170 [Serendipita vermifera]|nr:hypothetical protein CPB86DRAFT_706170 [Serendipita vermifera]